VILLGQSPRAGTVDWASLAEPARRISADHPAACARAVDPAATAFIMYTSGTTGFPKGVVRTHALIRNVEERAFRMAITPNDTILNYLPLFHAFGLSEGAWMSLLTGARQIVTRGFDPEESLDLIEQERVTIIHGFEAHMKGLSEAQEARPRDLSSLRTGIFAAGMLSATPVVRRGMRALAPLKNVSGFGMTETWLGVSLSSLDDDDMHRSEASGWPGLGYELRIVDDGSGDVLGPGVPGELQVRGWAVMKEYYKKPAETAAAFTRDGWFRTGDAAMWLPDGHLRFLGRYKDMLKVGGENAGRTPGRGACGLCRMPGGRHDRRRRGGRPLPRQDRKLQAAAACGVHRRLSDDRIGQDQKGRSARRCPKAARGLRLSGLRPQITLPCRMSLTSSGEQPSHSP
jgi:fatty-acyl-CoA synthase